MKKDTYKVQVVDRSGGRRNPKPAYNATAWGMQAAVELMRRMTSAKHVARCRPTGNNDDWSYFYLEDGKYRQVEASDVPPFKAMFQVAGFS